MLNIKWEIFMLTYSLARLHQDEKCTSSSLLHIRECSCLRHSSIADKENYFFPTPPWPYVDFSIKLWCISFLFCLKISKRRQECTLQCLHWDMYISMHISYWDFTSKNILDWGSIKLNCDNLNYKILNFTLHLSLHLPNIYPDVHLTLT